MTDSSDKTAGVLTPTFTKQSRISLIAFGIALLVVVVTAIGVYQFKWITKLPVPWPEGVKVNGQYRMLSMPDGFGRYRKSRPGDSIYEGYKAQGEYNEMSNDDWSNGIIADKNMDPLDMPSKGFDEERYDARSSNWYAQKYYIDGRPGSMVQSWQLDIYYYTGLKDTVAHVPDICAQAGGGKDVTTSTIEFTAPEAPESWNEPLTFLQTKYEAEDQNGDEVTVTSYYIFVFNGEPVVASNLNRARFLVRAGLSLPWNGSYNYFAKIQFAPRVRTVANMDVCDAEAQEFIEAALPAILPLLPTAEDIQALEDAKAESEKKK